MSPNSLTMPRSFQGTPAFSSLASNKLQPPCGKDDIEAMVSFEFLPLFNFFSYL